MSAAAPSSAWICSKNPHEQLLLDRVELPIGTVKDGKLTQLFVRTEPHNIHHPPGQKTLVNTKLLRRCVLREVSLRLEPAILLKEHDLFDHSIPPTNLAHCAPLWSDEEQTRHHERGRMDGGCEYFGGAPNLAIPKIHLLPGMPNRNTQEQVWREL